jgi:dinuclear metal center YbgI/SA1388 family protein
MVQLGQRLTKHYAWDMSTRQKTGSGRQRALSLAQLTACMEQLAPLRGAESWDKVGLQVGNPDRPIKTAMLCIDLTEAVLAGAIRNKAELIVSYHPPIFKPLATLTTRSVKERIVLDAIEQKIAIYSPHTALDAAEGGVNDWLAAGAGHGEITPTDDKDDDLAQLFKMVTYVPTASLEKVRQAMTAAGAGQIGAYSECSFSTVGQGTFRGDLTTNPAVGRPGQFEQVEEHRLEMIVDWPWVTDAYYALIEAHPYEEPAIDIFSLVDLWSSLPGIARMNWLDKPVGLQTIVGRYKKYLGLKHLKVAKSGRSGKVERVAVCAGAGGELLSQVIDEGADVFVTGEMRHHDVLDAVSKGTSIILAGHTNTERLYLGRYKKNLAKLTNKKVKWMISREDKAPIQIV